WRRSAPGDGAIHHPVGQAKLAVGVRKATNLTEFVRVHLKRAGDGWSAMPLAAQGSGVLSSLTAGAGLLVGPAQETALAEGDVYPVLVLDGATFDGAAVALSG